jgi:thioredoxin 1
MRRIFFTVAAAAPLILNAQSFADAPSLWTELAFAEAREKAAAEDRVLLVYATASWCPPCRMMERSTWQSEGVHEWFAEHGVAYKLDVDQQRELAEQHAVEFMPTMIAYRNNEPFDRIGGYKSDHELLE